MNGNPYNLPWKRVVRLVQTVVKQEEREEALVTYIRPSLARWLLKPERRAARGLPLPPLPDALGSTVVLFAGKDDWRGIDSFAPGFGLPFRWEKNTHDGPELPQGLAQVAEGVRKTLELDDWGLHLSPDLGGPDLSDWPVTADSAWAPLAASLRLASAGGLPRKDVFATGACKGGGIELVEGIPDKVAAIRGLLPKDGQARFWVPDENFYEAQRAVKDMAGGQIEVRAFPRGQNLKTSLDPHLFELDSPPLGTGPCSSDELDRRTAYANRPWVAGNMAERGRYYVESLVRPLADKLRSTLRKPYQRAVVNLGLFLGPETLTALAVCPPADIRFLATPESKARSWGRVCTLLNAHRATVEPWVIDPNAPSSATDCVREIAEWLRDVTHGQCSLAEITAGTKEMTAVLVTAARIAGADVGYILHDTLPGNRPKYGTERLVLLPWVHAV